MRKLMVVGLLIITGCVTSREPRGVQSALREGPDEFLVKAVVGPADDGTYVVPTTQRIAPAGETVLFSGRPTGIALSPDGSAVAVKGRLDLVFIDTSTRKVTQTLKLPEGGNSFRGIAWSAAGIVWTTSASKFLYGAKQDATGKWAWVETIELPGPKGDDNSTPGGIALDEINDIAYVTRSRNNDIVVVNLAARKIEAAIPVGIAPFDVLLNGSRAYVTNWGGRRPKPGDLTGPSSGSEVVIDEAGIASSGTVSVIDLETRQVTAEIEVDLHPSGMGLSPDRKRLFVANANSDTVSVVDLASHAVTDRWGVKPMHTLPFGSAPNALAASADGKTLYVANGGNNCIAVLDTANGRVRGLIPTGWYPGDVCLLGDGATLCVANTKGVGSRAQDDSEVTKQLSEHLGKPMAPGGFNSHEHMGSVSFIPVPGDSELEEFTYQTAVNMRLPLMNRILTMKEAPAAVTPVPSRPGEVSPIKHVLYIIKENRTYDQVFGDMPQGNGDPQFCHFGRDVTPNHHALAEEFVLLDNFYCNGVLSADGHQWTNEGYVTDYIEKSFGGFTRSYPYDGDDALAYASSGFIWDHVLAKGLTFRNYGEMVKAHITPNDATWTDIYRDYKNGQKTIDIRATTEVRGLEPYICPTFIGFPGKVQDVYRAEEFLKEFRACEEKGEWYNFVIMLLPNDHTSGTRPGMPTPRAAVADNDLALGRIVEAVSHSRFWPETAIFVVQDDPQAGLDHVDGHRTVALCISPYTKRRSVDSTHYNQNSMLRTMELILGLDPMNQLNMAANPMSGCFTDTPDLTPYVAKPNTIPLDEMNPALSSLKGKQRHWAKVSNEMPLDDIDRADEATFNRVIWHSVKGYDTPYPQLTRRPIAKGEAWAVADRDEEDDD
ncbi:MAG: phosphoesterase [Candidatus Hydrogenedentota bacterium]